MGRPLPEFSPRSQQYDPEGYFSKLSEWVAEHGQHIGNEMLERCGLAVLSALAVDEYPVAWSDVSPPEEIASLLRTPPSKLDVLAMFVRDQLWGMVAFKTNTECPNCAGDELRVLWDECGGGEVVLALTNGWAQFEDDQWERGSPTYTWPSR